MAEVLTPLEDASALAQDAPARTPWAQIRAMRDKLDVALQTIAEGRQILGGIEAECREASPEPQRPAGPGAAAGLGAILDQADAMAFTQRRDRR